MQARAKHPPRRTVFCIYLLVMISDGLSLNLSTPRLIIYSSKFWLEIGLTPRVLSPIEAMEPRSFVDDQPGQTTSVKGQARREKSSIDARIPSVSYRGQAGTNFGTKIRQLLFTLPLSQGRKFGAHDVGVSRGPAVARISEIS